MKYLTKKDKSFKSKPHVHADPVIPGDSRITDSHWDSIVHSNQAQTQKEKALLDALGLTKK